MDDLLKFPLRTAVRFLEEHKHRYAVIGGIALSQWGVIRATEDVDFKVLVPNTEYSPVRSALRAAFPKRARPHVPENPFIVDVKINDVSVDFLLALPGYEELIIERAVQRDLDGQLVWVCSLEDLIIQKVVAGRAKDREDLEKLLRVHRGNLAEDYIKDWLSQFAEALDNPELVTEYQKLRDKIQSFE